jgi:hypothetical protein
LTVILATLFGLSVPLFDVEAGPDRALLATAVRTLLSGIEFGAPRASRKSPDFLNPHPANDAGEPVPED